MSCPQVGWFAAPWPIVPLDDKTFPTVFLPAQLGYYAAALLVTFPGTYYIRIALLPLWLFLVIRLGTLDISEGDPKRNADNMGTMTWACIISFRMIVWAFAKKHYTRVGKGRDPSKSRPISQVLWDAGDLCFNFRGIGWDWSKRYATIKPVPYLPSDPKKRTRAFLWYNFTGFMRTGLIFEAAHYLNAHLFDENFPVPIPLAVKRYIQVMLYPIAVYGSLEAEHRIVQLIAVLIFRQAPDEWPPLYNSPWRSTSLSELWNVRWHQAYRDMLSNTGGVALGYPLGRVGYVLGAFIASGVYHDIGMWSIQRERGMCCFLSPMFILNGVGVVVEHLFTKVTGRRVGGVAGWLWWVTWTSVCLLLTFDAPCMRLVYQFIEVNWFTRPVHITRTIVTALLGLIS
ncbi:hypothetical protein BDZ89DRAFT_726549 [Hymenopellis radicata]|nr:hypothetical protein BDZ89DRAFT_726549 [Hymenopellis radicata]